MKRKQNEKSKRKHIEAILQQKENMLYSHFNY